MHVATLTEDREAAMTDHSDDGPLTSEQAAAMLGLTKSRVNQLVLETEPGRPKLKAERFGRAWRIDRASVMRYLDYKKRLEAAKNSVVWEDAE